MGVGLALIGSRPRSRDRGDPVAERGRGTSPVCRNCSNQRSRLKPLRRIRSAPCAWRCRAASADNRGSGPGLVIETTSAVPGHLPRHVGQNGEVVTAFRRRASASAALAARCRRQRNRRHRHRPHRHRQPCLCPPPLPALPLPAPSPVPLPPLPALDMPACKCNSIATVKRAPWFHASRPRHRANRCQRKASAHKLRFKPAFLGLGANGATAATGALLIPGPVVPARQPTQDGDADAQTHPPAAALIFAGASLRECPDDRGPDHRATDQAGLPQHRVQQQGRPAQGRGPARRQRA